jgi:hypothetical protein
MTSRLMPSRLCAHLEHRRRYPWMLQKPFGVSLMTHLLRPEHQLEPMRWLWPIRPATATSRQSDVTNRLSIGCPRQKGAGRNEWQLSENLKGNPNDRKGAHTCPLVASQCVPEKTYLMTGRCSLETVCFATCKKSRTAVRSSERAGIMTPESSALPASPILRGSIPKRLKRL